MRVAVTGATGFLGRYIVNDLLKRGHTCRCWYRPGSDRGGFEEISATQGVEWCAGQLGDTSATQALVDGVEAVVHAALDHGGGSDVVATWQNNLMGSLQLMQIANRAGVGRFVFISTCAVHDRILDDRPLDEAHPLWPSSHYGAHKAALEKFVHSFGLGAGWPICALRPTGIYGLRRPVERGRWFDLVQKVIAGEAIDTVAGGKEVHAADVAKAVAILLDADAAKITGEAFNCYDRYVTQEHVAELAKCACGSASSITLHNHEPKHQIDTTKLEALGMQFGGEPLLAQYVQALVAAVR